MEELGAGPETLAALARGELAFAEVLRQAKNPMLILGMGALARPDGAAVMSLAASLARELGLIKDDWNGFNVLHTAAARVGGLDLGLVPGQGGRDVAAILEGAQSGEIEVVFLIGADELDTSGLGDAFVVYQGHHGDRGAQAADVILPGAAYTEKNASWVNTEGRLQRGKLAAFPPGEAKEDWKILRALSEVLDRKVPLDTLGQVRARMAELAAPLNAIDRVEPAVWGKSGCRAARSAGLRLADRRFLPDQPDQPGVDGDGRVQPAVRARRRAGGDRHPWLRRSTAPSGR